MPRPKRLTLEEITRAIGDAGIDGESERQEIARKLYEAMAGNRGPAVAWCQALIRAVPGTYSGRAYGTSGGRATMDNPKESGEIEFSADLLASLISPKAAETPPDIHRPREAALSLVITKNRYGPAGEVRLVFDLVA